MSATIPPTPAAIDLLASYAENGAYIKPDGIKDAITIVLDELNRAAGEIVTLREQEAEAAESLSKLVNELAEYNKAAEAKKL